MPPVSEKFVDLACPERLWVVAAIHGNHERLITLHDHLAGRFRVRDRLVYTGNYLSATSFDNHAVLEELLAFRAALLAKPGMEPRDIVHLRGPAEEAWQRLLRLQFAPSPSRALDQYLAAGAEAYLRLYGVSMNDTRSMARAGSVSITRWTNQLRGLQRQALGHEALACSLRRAAVTAPCGEHQARVLIVPAGYDMSRSLEEQTDQLWFGKMPFQAEGQGAKFARIIRGFDPAQGGVHLEDIAVTLDGGCGFGGPLVCACFDALGTLLEIIAVGGKGAIETSRFEDIGRAPIHESALPAPRPAASVHGTACIAS
ncbi:MAG: hypothetical protein FWF24_07145 [Alphaproteobacteria bacterium]|nr:hypothetical protein [Alphaproteobacteria bacterium]